MLRTAFKDARQDYEPIIHVENLVKRYRHSETAAVDGLSFDVRPGEFFALLGPNGAGKTTTISILTTTLAKTSGTVTIAGHDLDAQAKDGPPEHRHHLPESEPGLEPDGRGEHPVSCEPVRHLWLQAQLSPDAEKLPREGNGARARCWASLRRSSSRSRPSRGA